MAGSAQKDTRGRLALITGAAAGLARGIAGRLAASGYRIVLTHRDGGTAPDATLALVRAHDAESFSLALDLADPAAATAAVAEIERRRGPLDILVHTAGPIVVRRFAASGFAEYRTMIDQNLGSAVALADAVLPGMRARGFGRLVFFGMNGSHVTTPAVGMALYGSAKAAVVAFARTLALEEAAAGISVNVIEPGDIRQKYADRDAARALPAKNPTGHAGSWEDIAESVRFLIAAENGFLNGVVLGVHGGLVAVHE